MDHEDAALRSLKVRALIVKDGSRHQSSRTAEDVRRIFREVDEIWRQAQLRFTVEILEWSPRQELVEEVVDAAFRRQRDVASLGAVTGTRPAPNHSILCPLDRRVEREGVQAKEGGGRC